MLARLQGSAGDPSAGHGDRQASGLDLAGLWRVARRQWPLIVGVTALVIGLGAAYYVTAQRSFTASAVIMIDTRKNQALPNNTQVVGDQAMDASGIESQVEILKSESVALAVIRDLKLVGSPIFSSSSMLGTVLGFIAGGGGDGDSQFAAERRTAEVFARNLQVKRVGLTYAITVSFTSISPESSAEIANAIADAYMVNELESRYQATKRASRWLQDRIQELRQQASAADSSVQQFRADNNIVDTGRGLMSEQQLGDVNSQLVTARASTAEAKAKLDRIRDVMKGEIPDASVTDALKNDVITRLRAQLLDISAKEADWSARFGIGHAAAVNLRNQMREIRRSIQSELQRIAETYQSDYEIARARETSLQESLGKLVSEAGSSGQAQVKLRDLESSAQTSRNLYDSFLQRFMEATQQQTFPISDARVITAATPPLKKSAPRGMLIFGGCGLLGLMMGAAAALARERMDNVFRTEGQVETVLGAECLGIFPRIDEVASTGKVQGPPVALAQGLRPIEPVSSVLRHVLDAPFSRFTETLRSVKVAADIRGLSRQTRVIGVVSAVPNEGKTTIASNLAELMAQTGNKVLLIDGDLRNPKLTRSLVASAEVGLVEVLSGAKTIQEVLYADPTTGLHVIPAVLRGRIWHTAELISSNAMASLLQAAKASYDYVIIDLPPVVPVVDVRAAAHLIDGFVCVVEWGRTSRDVVAEAMSTVDVMRERLIGVVLNKASASTLKRLESYKGRYYTSYYRDHGEAA